MRHGRKSRTVRFDGYERHITWDLDTGLIPAAGITSGNAHRQLWLTILGCIRTAFQQLRH